MTDIVALLWTIVLLLALEGKISYREGAGLRMAARRPAGHWAAHKDDGKKK